MDSKQTELFTAGKIAESLQVSPGKVKKAIIELDIQPTSKKGVCNYYSKEIVKLLESHIK